MTPASRLGRRYPAAHAEHPEVRAILKEFFGLLHALYWSHWTAHWQVQGNPFYGDHLLFERLYQGVVEEIDTLAEKMVARFGPTVVDAVDHFPVTQAWVERWSVQESPYKRALMAESDFQSAAKRVYDHIKEAGAMSLGLDDYLMAIANDHETNMYLLQQRLRTDGVLNKTAKVLDTVFVVVDPSDLSEFGDIIFEANAAHLANYLIGTGGNKWRAEHSTLHDNKQSAIQDAVDRLKKFWGGKPPANVLPKNLDVGRLASFERRATPGLDHLDGDGEADMSAEGHFFDKPRAREVREFAQSGAITNSPEVAKGALKADELAESPRKVKKQVDASPPTVTEIVDDTPGSGEFSTLSRYVVETAQTDEPGVPQGHHEVPKAPDAVKTRVANRWLASIGSLSAS